MLVSEFQEIIKKIPSHLLKRIDIKNGYIDLYSEKTKIARQVDLCSNTKEFEIKVKKALLELSPKIILCKDTTEILKVFSKYLGVEEYYFKITETADIYYIEICRPDNELMLKFILCKAEAIVINNHFNLENKPLLATLLYYIRD